MDNHVRDLFRAVLDKTEAGKLEWTSFDPEAFWTKIGSNTLHLTRVSAEGEPVVYSIQVTDHLGLPVFEFEERPGAADFSLADKLFQTVRATPSKSERVIQDMLRALKTSA